MPRLNSCGALLGLIALALVPGLCLGQVVPTHSEEAPSPDIRSEASSAGARVDNASAQLETVIVNGKRPYDEQELEEKIIPQFVRSHGATTKIDQLARWRDAICPITNGLLPEFNAYISARVKEIAADVGAPVEENCALNVQVTFTTEPQKLVDEYVQNDSSILGYHYVAQRTKLATVRHPIQAWYVTATRTSRGGLFIDDPVKRVRFRDREILGPEGFDGPAGSGGSKFTSGLSSEFARVLVVVDLNNVDGSSVGALADYVAMLVLAQAKTIDDCSDLPSILDLWSAKCGTRPKPSSLTDADTAYLKALYSINIENFVGLQRSAIGNNMLRDIAEGH